MSFTLSPKEVASIHLILATLPIPPIPVHVSISSAGIEFSDMKQAFEIATCEILRTTETGDKVVNTHSIIAAMMLFHKWTKFGNNPVTSEKIKASQEKIILELMQDVLDLETERVQSQDCTHDVYKLFLNASTKWIKNYQPDGAVIDIVQANLKSIHNEHDIHIAMSHYSYSQGVLYSDKSSSLQCAVHDNLSKEYTQMVYKAKDDQDSDESLRLDNETVREECMEVAELYSQFDIEKLCMLAYTRILQVLDSLHVEPRHACLCL